MEKCKMIPSAVRRSSENDIWEGINYLLSLSDMITDIDI